MADESNITIKAKTPSGEITVYANDPKYWYRQSKKSAEESKVWAEGSDEQVEALGGEHSAKGWANKVYQDTTEQIAAHNESNTAHEDIRQLISNEVRDRQAADLAIEQQIPTVGSGTITFTQGGVDKGSVNVNQSANETIALDAAPVDSVNGKTGAVTLNAADVGALPSTTTINNLTTSAQQEAINSTATLAKINQIATNTNDIATNTNAIATNTGDIAAINSLIPAQATTSNKLADKQFVNSSIATNTANFIGTFETVTDLEAYSGDITNNDYAFVVNSVVTDNGDDWATLNALNAYDKTLLTNFDYAWVINGAKFDLYRFDIIEQAWSLRVSNTAKADVTLNTAYNRYKATVSDSTVTWAFEYTLNNSSFTAAQWAAINSGITSGDVSLIATALQPGDNVSGLVNDAGYITGIDSTDVTTALGYTPYDASNPSGYTDNVGTVTSVNNELPDANGNVTINIPSDVTDVTVNNVSVVNNERVAQLTVDNSMSTSSTNPVQNKVVNAELLKKQDAFNTVYPLQLATQTTGAPHNYTITGTTVTADLANSGYMQEHYTNTDGDYVWFKNDNYTSYNPSFTDVTFDDMWGYQMAYIEIPLNYGKLIDDFVNGETSSISAYARLSNGSTGSTNGLWVLGEKLNGVFNPVVVSNSTSSYNESNERHFVCDPEVARIEKPYMYYPKEFEGYGRGTTTPNGNYTHVALVANNSSYIIQTQSSSGTSSAAWRNMDMPLTMGPVLRRINCARFYSTATSNIPAWNAADVVNNATGWTLADGIQTSYNMIIKYDNQTIKKNANNELYADLSSKQDTLVSGTNIKTINSQSLLGTGNIEIQGGTTISVDSELSTTSENPVQNKVITKTLNKKQEQLTPVLPVKIEQVTESLMHNYTVSGTTAAPQYTNIDASLESTYYLVRSSVAVQSNEPSIENVLNGSSYIAVPVNYSTQFSEFNSATIKIGGYSGNSIGYYAIFFCSHEDNKLKAKFVIDADDFGRVTSSTYTLNGNNLTIPVGDVSHFYDSSTSLTTDTKNFLITVTYDSDGIKFTRETQTGTSSIKASKTINATYLNDLQAIDTVLFVTETNAGDSIQTTLTTYEPTGWTLQESTATYNNISVLYDNNTIKKNSSGQLYADIQPGDSLPSQTGQSGKFLTTDGTDASWANIPSVTVDQTYNSASTNAQSGTAVAEAISGITIIDGGTIE